MNRHFLPVLHPTPPPTLVASYYLGFAIIVVILLANVLTLMAHVPAIRDRQLPPPRTHEEALAFHTKARTHTIITTARKWGYASMVFLLVLILSLRTVPDIYQKAHDQYRATRHHQGPRHPPVAVPGERADAAPQPYAFCEQTYSRDRLSVLDLAHVSNAAYMEEEDLKAYLVEEIPRHHFTNVSKLDLGNYGPVTYLFDLPKTKVLVFGVRGTNEVFDLYQDLDSYSEAILIQLTTSLFPLYASPIFQNVLNKLVGTSYHLVEALSFLKDILLNRQRGSNQGEMTKGRRSSSVTRYYYDALSTYVQETILANPYYGDYQLLFTGHSLGGGVAQVVAARLKGVAVVFSAPGLVLSRRKFKINLSDIDSFCINVCPIGDLVPLIDIQGIKAQNIRCSRERLSYHCHSILSTIDEIQGSCSGTPDEDGGAGGGRDEM